MKANIVDAFPGSVPEASPVASHRCHQPSRPRRRRHRTRRSVKNRYGSWVTLPRPRPVQLTPAHMAAISMEDREKSRKRVVSVASQADCGANCAGGPSSSASRGAAGVGVGSPGAGGGSRSSFTGFSGTFYEGTVFPGRRDASASQGATGAGT